MILPRGIYNESPPERRTRVSNNPTLLYSWWCTIFSLVVIIFRVSGRYVRNERLFREDKIMALSTIPLLARMACVHIVLIYGTNNVDLDGLVDPGRIRRREIGSKAVLAARIFYAGYIWMCKGAISEFLKRMTERFWKRGYEHGLRCIRAFLVLSYVGVVVSVLAECQPFDHYWQVIPDPGPRCRQGYANLLTMGITDIITDILLVVFPIPILLRSGMGIRRKISLVALFSLSLILVGIAGARIPLVMEKRGLQQFRTVWASSEVLAATFVANAIILGSFLRDRGIKKQKYRPGGSTQDSFDRRSSTRRPTLQELDSDENLARELGYRTNPALQDPDKGKPRPAAPVNLSLVTPARSQAPFSNGSWKFPNSTDGADDNGHLKPRFSDEPLPSPRGGRRVSFFDAGGLLEEGNQPTPSPSESVVTYDFAFPQPRQASGALSRNNHQRRSSRLSQQSTEYEMPANGARELQDLASFLRSDSDDTTKTAVESKEGSPTTSSPQQRGPPPATQSNRRTSQAPSYGSLPSIQDVGGLLSSSQS